MPAELLGSRKGSLADIKHPGSSPLFRSLSPAADLALLCEHVIASLFSVAPQQPQQANGEAKPPVDAAVPNLGEFIVRPRPRRIPRLLSSSRHTTDSLSLCRIQAYALYRTRLPVSITHQALLLLTRLKQRYPSARGTSTSPHRLFLSSLMLSSKISMDDTYSNKSWQIVGQGLFELREVNQMERELFAFLGYVLDEVSFRCCALSQKLTN